MDINALITQFGYPVVFLGAILEGETVLVLAGYAAHRGLLDPTKVVLIAWTGAVLGDQAYFWLGRRYGRALLARSPWLAGKLARATALIERHPAKIILVMRFLWGLRIALPVGLGLSRIKGRVYLPLNVFSSLLWAILVGGVGYLFGALLERYVDQLHQAEHWIIGGVLTVALITHLVLRWYRRRQPAPAPESLQPLALPVLPPLVRRARRDTHTGPDDGQS